MNSRHDTASLTGALDQAFMARVHKTSLFMAGLVSAFAAVYDIGGNWALGFLLSAGWSIANVWTLERLVRGAIRPDGRDKIAIALGIFVKMPLLYAAFLLLLVYGSFAASSVFVGVSVPLVVIVLKIAGRMLALRLRATDSSVPQPRS